MKNDDAKNTPVLKYRDRINKDTVLLLCPTCWHGVNIFDKECQHCGQKLKDSVEVIVK